MLVLGNALRIPIADESVQCVVTSPPYWGLRDYGTGQWIGGDQSGECLHIVHTNKHGGTSNRPGLEAQTYHYRDQSGKSGATRVDNQLGLEPTPDEFVANMVAVFRGVRRVLRDDGTCFVNLGDSYASSGVSGKQDGLDEYAKTVRNQNGNGPKGNARVYGRAPTANGLKPKDLIGIPWRVALALQADGWYLRSDIIWAKPNPMPESVTDRPTKSHEYVFLLTKSSSYYWDAEAVREKQTTPLHARGGISHEGLLCGPMERLKADGTSASQYADHDRIWGNESGRNIRTVWTIPTESYPGHHFATFPRKLVEPCVKAGTSQKGCCPECGKGWVREVELTPEYAAVLASGKAWRDNSGKPNGFVNRHPTTHPQNVPTKNKTTGWRPQCQHGHAPVPCLVFDPFTGSGTTGVVAEGLHRRFVGIDLSRQYLKLANRRINRPHAPIARPGRIEHHPLFDRIEAPA